jgi:hypothetical protein
LIGRLEFDGREIEAHRTKVCHWPMHSPATTGARLAKPATPQRPGKSWLGCEKNQKSFGMMTFIRVS